MALQLPRVVQAKLVALSGVLASQCQHVQSALDLVAEVSLTGQQAFGNLR